MSGSIFPIEHELNDSQYDDESSDHRRSQSVEKADAQAMVVPRFGQGVVDGAITHL